MNTPNNAAALERLEQKWRESAKTERDYYSDALVACANELATLRATLTQQDTTDWERALDRATDRIVAAQTITSQPGGDAPEWVELKRNEFGYFYQTSAPAVMMPTGRYFFHPNHPADAPSAAGGADYRKLRSAVYRDLAAKYAELIYAVGRKWPGETRHQTALRYINERESLSSAKDCGSSAALAPKPEGE